MTTKGLFQLLKLRTTNLSSVHKTQQPVYRLAHTLISRLPFLPQHAIARSVLARGNVYRQPSLSWSVVHNYSKKVNKEKASKGGKKKVHIELNQEDLEGVLNVQKLEEEMQAIVEELKHQLSQHISLRTSVATFNNLPVKTDDGVFPLVQLAQVTQKTPSLIIVNMTSAPQCILAVKDALANSGLNVNPQQDGTTFFIPIPKVTREHRETLAKNAKVLHDKAKTKLRDLHNKYIKKVKAAKEHHPEDFIRGAQELVLDEMHNFSVQLDDLLAVKQNELLNVML